MKKYETDEERLAARRETVRRYNPSAKGKANEKRRDPEKAKAVWARYRETDKYQAAQERRRIKDQALGWPVQLRALRKARMDPNRGLAYQAVTWAERFGLLIRPETCERCGSGAKLHAHHHNGYEREHWIDVQYLCSPCHRTVHR